MRTKNIGCGWLAGLVVAALTASSVASADEPSAAGEALLRRPAEERLFGDAPRPRPAAALSAGYDGWHGGGHGGYTRIYVTRGYSSGYYGPSGRQSPLAMAGGITLVTLGSLSLLGAGAIGVARAAAPEGCNSCNGATPIALGLAIGGLVGIVAGIPLIVYGARPRSGGTFVVDARPSWVGAPGGAGWVWRF